MTASSETSSIDDRFSGRHSSPICGGQLRTEGQLLCSHLKLAASSRGLCSRGAEKDNKVRMIISGASLPQGNHRRDLKNSQIAGNTAQRTPIQFRHESFWGAKARRRFISIAMPTKDMAVFMRYTLTGRQGPYRNRVREDQKTPSLTASRKGHRVLPDTCWVRPRVKSAHLTV